jgi:hypothetical protein
MMHVKLAGSARRVHRSEDGTVTACGRAVPQKLDEAYRWARPKFRSTHQRYGLRRCKLCDVKK